MNWGVNIYYIKWYTANDNKHRDPVNWTIEGSNYYNKDIFKERCITLEVSKNSKNFYRIDDKSLYNSIETSKNSVLSADFASKLDPKVAQKRVRNRDPKNLIKTAICMLEN